MRKVAELAGFRGLRKRRERALTEYAANHRAPFWRLPTALKNALGPPPRVSIASAAVFLAFEPSDGFVKRVIRWLTDFCHLTLCDLELVARLRLAVNELVENVVKYGLQPNVRVEVELERRGDSTIWQSLRQSLAGCCSLMLVKSFMPEAFLTATR